MTDTLIHFPIYIGDALKKFIEFPTFEERGAWLSIQVAMINNDGFLPDDETLFYKCLCFSDISKQVLKQMLSKCYTKVESGWESEEIKTLISNQKKLRDKRKEAGAKGGRAAANAQANATAKSEQVLKQSESESESESENQNYRFKGKIIRLNEKDYLAWKKSYHRIINFDAELQLADDWLAANKKQDGWFLTTSRWLNKKQQELPEPKKKPTQDSKFKNMQDWINVGK